MKYLKIILTLLVGFVSIGSVYSQIICYDPLTTLLEKDDSTRWAKNDSLLLNHISLTNVERLLYMFAQIEYRLNSFEKVREYCEQLNQMNPKLWKTHLLVGKAYASSSKICGIDGQPSAFTNYQILWAAYNEWEIALSKANKEGKGDIKSIMKKYNAYLPDKADLSSCMGIGLQVGDTSFVGCWIQRNTFVRVKE